MSTQEKAKTVVKDRLAKIATSKLATHVETAAKPAAVAEAVAKAAAPGGKSLKAVRKARRQNFHNFQVPTNLKERVTRPLKKVGDEKVESNSYVLTLHTEQFRNASVRLDHLAVFAGLAAELQKKVGAEALDSTGSGYVLGNYEALPTSGVVLKHLRTNVCTFLPGHVLHDLGEAAADYFREEAQLKRQKLESMEVDEDDTQSEGADNE